MVFQMFFHNVSSREINGSPAPTLPRLSIENGSLHFNLDPSPSNPYRVSMTSIPVVSRPPVAFSSNDASTSRALVPYRPSRPATAVSTTFSMTSSAFNFTPPPPIYLGSYEKEAMADYLTPPHANCGRDRRVTDVESVYEVHEMSLFDRFQSSYQLRMVFILALSFIVIGGIAAGVLVLLARKA
ncbi:hypothetical protein H072_4388 [Dactylellina haptotyla CBS 200.50]|uniref:Uncharacterized protein n=1 Tax=Dactylellina haptotyla (strain CBS 200.50) TaxID=1284197 RepID=S8BQI7_DACHA|nr:hypothetical protein H072_4388 [Dactylellina haptotyla CBS 200.50]